MDFDDYYEGYLYYISQLFENDPVAYEKAVDDMEQYDTDEWDFRGAYREYLTDHPDIEFHECETAGAQGICQVAGTFCDHPMTAHRDAYWQN